MARDSRQNETGSGKKSIGYALYPETGAQV
jgi:hypothetical protein